MDDRARGRPGARAVPILGCDGFLLALDHLMRCRGQGTHVSQSVLELDRAPEPGALVPAWKSFVDRHPIVVARLGRSLRSGLPVWRVPGPAKAIAPEPVRWWHEPGARGPKAVKSRPAESLESLCLQLRDHRRATRTGAPFNLRLDVLARRDQDAALVVSWSHLLVDGKGVELIVTELGRHDAQPGASDPEAGAVPAVRPTSEASSIREKFARSRAFVDHFSKLATTKFQSLGGPRPVAGPCYCRVITLDRSTTAMVNARAQEMASQLIHTPFFLAAAAIAHARVFEARGLGRGPQIITLPVQTRPKGAGGALFQNHVAILFFRLQAEDLCDVQSATHALLRQFTTMMRDRLDTSFSMMLDLMRWIPPRFYSMFLRAQMRGEITSFFHSYTGPFAPGLELFFGARVTAAWHIPVISTPPGTGLFVGERHGRLSLSMSWRQGAISEQEQEVLMHSFIEALVGEAPQCLTINLRA